MISLHKLHQRIKEPLMYLVDIGASSGVPTDPVYDFITDKRFKGLCIEGNKDKVEILRKNTHFSIYDKYIYPDSIIDVFRQNDVPKVFDILKIDIDGFDLEILRRILEQYKPYIIIAEINEKIPPPIRFETLFKPDYTWDESHLFGFSIAAGEKVFKENKYSILQIYDFSNIVCAQDTLVLEPIVSIDKMYKEQYVEHPDRKTAIWWNKSVDYWLDIEDTEELAFEINRYFSVNNERSRLNQKKHLGVDYSLEY